MSKKVERICPRCKETSTYRKDYIYCNSVKCKQIAKEQKAQEAEKPLNDREAFLKSEVSRLNSELTQAKQVRGYHEVVSEEIMEAVDALTPLPPSEYKKADVSGSDINAVIKLSDWHTGAVVQEDAVEGLGRYNWQIQQDRAEYITTKFLDWVETHRRSFNIPKLYIFSEGDMVNGDLHYESIVTNEFPTPVQSINAGTLLAHVVSTLAPHFPEVHLVEIDIDNHSRLTKKLQFADGNRNSWGYVVHSMANALLREHGNIEVTRAKGLKELVNVNGIKFLVEHGHTIKSWMGIPFYGMERLKGKEALRRMQSMLDKNRKDEFLQYQKEIGFDYMSMGHWHVGSIINENILVNGSLMGTTEFDHAFGRYARPAQVSFLVHPRHKIFDWVAWRVKR